MPAATGVINVGWYSTNSGRKYPLHEDASALADDGAFRLPNNFLVDAVLPVHSDVSLDPTQFHVLSLAVSGNGVVLGIGYAGVQIGVINIDKAAFTRYKTFNLNCSGRFFDSVGRFTFGSLDEVLKFPGLHTFTVEAGRLEITAIRPSLRGVTAIYAKGPSDQIGPLQGDVVIEAGRNEILQFTAGDGSTTNPDRIKISAVDGVGQGQDCGCGPTVKPPIRTISGLPPDVDGNFPLLGSACIDVSPAAGGLGLSDVCAKPCCGCAQLNEFLPELQAALTAIQNMDLSVSRQESAITNLANNFPITF